MPDREPTATLTKLSLYPTDAPREYRVTLITAGRVKNRDQSLADWEITPDAIMHATPLANGRAVFIDHAGTTSHPEPPSIRNLVGVTTNVKFDPHRLALDGTIRLYDREDTRWVQQLLDQITADQASDRPTPDIGLSMVFFGHHRFTQQKGEPTQTRITDSIDHIESIDIVFGPAANGRIHHALATHTTAPAGSATRRPNQQENHMETQTQYITEPNEITDQPTTTADTSTVPNKERETSNEERANHLSSPSSPLSSRTVDAAALMAHLNTLNQRIEHLAAATASLIENKVITGLGTPPTPQPTRRSPLSHLGEGQGVRVHSMWTGLDRLQAAYEHLMGLPAHGDFERLTGIRELYTVLTGDRQLTGRYNPTMAMLAYDPNGNNADTTSMAELTRNVMNKVMIQQVELLQEYRWWERIAHIQDFNSLQQVSWVRVGGIGDIPTVAEKAEYTQLAWDDARTTADWVKKGGYLPLSLEMIDRDDVEAWRSVPRQLATAAMVTLSSVVSALFTDNNGVGPQITTEGHTAYAFSNTWGNILTQPLTYENWQTAIETMYKMSQLNVTGRRIAVRPKFLLVPVELEAQGISVVTSDRRPGTDFNDRVPVKRMLPEENVITVPHWTDAESWAAVADPNLCPFAGVGFRYGRTPELFTASDPNTHLLFTNDVLPIKVRWFFAVSVIDPRGAVKSNA